MLEIPFLSGSLQPYQSANLIADVVSERVKLIIPIMDAQGNRIGCLSPLTVSSLGDKTLIEAMTRWRNHSARFFLTQFDATPERTRQWLENTVLSDPSRLLFTINSASKLIGHYGFKDLSSMSAEVDSLLRGESGGHPQLIYFAEIALVGWLFSTFEINNLYGYVLAENWQALELHARVGFENAELIPLTKETSVAETIYRLGLPGNESSDSLYSQKISLHRRNFISKGDTK